MIYRVTVKTTGSVQPASSATFWGRDVVYCGTDLEEARVEYLRARGADYGGGFGNRARETVIEAFESEPEEIGDETPADLETEAE